MKKKLTLFILIPSLLISSSIYANSLLGTVGEIYVAKKVLNHKKLVLGGALLVGIGGFAGYKITKEKFIDMIEHPQDHEDMMLTLIEEHPLQLNAFKVFLNYNIEHTDDLEYKQSVLDFEDYYHIGKEDVVYNKIIESPEYKNYLSIVTAKAKSIKDKYNDDKNKRICNIEYYNEIAHSYVDFPTETLLSKGNIDDFYSVNRYGNFSNITGSGKTPDHIPSYKSIEKFLILKGVPNISNKRKDNPLLVDNTSALNINTIEHQKGSRTFGGRNNNSVSDLDSEDLLSASLKDIATFATYLIIEKHKNPIDYLESSYTLLKRNYYLCLYEKEEENE